MISREKLEEKQISIYIIIIIISVFVGLNWDSSHILEKTIEPIIGVLLYSMFCQIPFLELKQALKNRSFFKALLFGNFVLIPLLVWALISIFPTTPIITLGIALVLLTPCIDYVIVFSHLGKGNSKAVLASTPLLFIFQMLLLPLYLWVFLGKETISIIEITPFVKAFLYLIVIPFVLSIVTQVVKIKQQSRKNDFEFFGLVACSVYGIDLFCGYRFTNRSVIQQSRTYLKSIPIYIAFAVIAPFIGKLSAKLFKVDIQSSRAISFSTSTRNSLVVLPLALALPAPENQLVAVVIATQTIVEIFFELIYIKVIPIITKENKKQRS